MEWTAKVALYFISECVKARESAMPISFGNIIMIPKIKRDCAIILAPRKRDDNNCLDFKFKLW